MSAEEKSKGAKMPRYAANVDKNQGAIVEALEKLGFSVEKGHDDILVGKHGRTWWFEIKSDNAVSKKTGKVRNKAKKKSQIRLDSEWRGHYRIVSSLQEILDDIKNN